MFFLTPGLCDACREREATVTVKLREGLRLLTPAGPVIWWELYMCVPCWREWWRQGLFKVPEE